MYNVKDKTREQLVNELVRLEQIDDTKGLTTREYARYSNIEKEIKIRDGAKF